MTNQWFRSWHGAPTDPKWLGIARKAGVAPGIVSALVWALLDRASQASDRGSIAGYDADGLACFMGCEPEQVEAVIALMHEKSILESNAFSGWEKHQPRREDDSKQRVREFRERSKTQGNAPVTQCNAEKLPETLDTDTDTDTDTEKETQKKVLREASGELEFKLREAAGWQQQPAPNLAVTGPIEELIASGAILERDVLPVIKAHAPRVRRPTSWAYFVPIIQDAVAIRQRAGTGPPKHNGVNASPQKTFDELRKELVPEWNPGTKYASTTG
jgi:hypothetical protein